MRNISVALTEPQILDESKDVTRRLGWTDLKPGTLLQPVLKGQGLSHRGSPVYRHVGDRRWECEWYELTPAALKRHEDPDYEHDHDRDEVCRVSVHASKEAAIADAKKVAAKSVYGSAVVQQHEVVQDEFHQAAGEWEPVGSTFEVDVNGEVIEV